MRSVKRFLMSRKFILALLITVFGSTALGLHWLTGGEFVTLASLVMSLYGASNVLQKHVEKDPTDDLEA